MARIAIDIDSTLYDFSTVCREAFFRLASENPEMTVGAYHPWTEWRSPVDACGLDAFIQVCKVVHDEDMINQQEPFKGAVDTCQRLAAKHDLLLISNRHTDSTEATRHWLSVWGFLGGSAELVITEDDKRPFMVDCQYLIDDRPRTVVEFVYDFDWQMRHRGSGQPAPQRQAFMVAYPYNQNLTDIPNIYLAPTWLGIRHYLEKKGVL